MLGKLIIHEIKQTYKPVSIVILILIGSTLLSNLETNICMGLDVSGNNPLVVFFSTLLGFVFGGASIAVATVSFVFLCLNFYKSMFAERGYLTHTLPVCGSMTFNVKWIVATIWMLVSVAVIVICWLLRAVNITKESFEEFFSRLSALYLPQDIDLSELLFIGRSVSGTVTIFALLALLGIAGTFLFFFSSMTMGQISNKNKIGRAIGTGIVLFIIQQLISSGILAIFLLGTINSFTDFSMLAGVVNKIFVTSILFYILIMVVEYVIDILIIRKHLNLQ